MVGGLPLPCAHSLTLDCARSKKGAEVLIASALPLAVIHRSASRETVQGLIAARVVPRTVSTGSPAAAPSSSSAIANPATTSLFTNFDMARLPSPDGP